MCRNVLKKGQAARVDSLLVYKKVISSVIRTYIDIGMPTYYCGCDI